MKDTNVIPFAPITKNRNAFKSKVLQLKLEKTEEVDLQKEPTLEEVKKLIVENLDQTDEINYEVSKCVVEEGLQYMGPIESNNSHLYIAMLDNPEFYIINQGLEQDLLGNAKRSLKIVLAGKGIPFVTPERGGVIFDSADDDRKHVCYEHRDINGMFVGYNELITNIACVEDGKAEYTGSDLEMRIPDEGGYKLNSEHVDLIDLAEELNVHKGNIGFHARHPGTIKTPGLFTLMNELGDEIKHVNEYQLNEIANEKRLSRAEEFNKKVEKQLIEDFWMREKVLA